MLLKVKHARTLPTYASPHQMATVSRKIHDRVKDAVVPLVDANPQYYAVVLTLSQLDEAVNQLKTALNQRKFKKATALRGVGGADGLNGDASVTDELTLSAMKRKAYQKRQMVMKRFRFVLEWKLQDAIEMDDADTLAAARKVGKALSRRIDDFERGSYEESEQEFDLLFESIDSDQAAQDALPVLDLTKVYADLKAAHNRYQAVYDEQTKLDAKREELPKVTESADNLRRVVRALLSMLHLDVATGNPLLNPVLGHVDEMIDKVRAVSKRRNTLDKKAKAKAKAKTKAEAETEAEDKVQQKGKAKDNDKQEDQVQEVGKVEPEDSVDSSDSSDAKPADSDSAPGASGAADAAMTAEAAVTAGASSSASAGDQVGVSADADADADPRHDGTGGETESPSSKTG